jgi:hypothetical protein
LEKVSNSLSVCRRWVWFQIGVRSTSSPLQVCIHPEWQAGCRATRPEIATREISGGLLPAAHPGAPPAGTAPHQMSDLPEARFTPVT